MFPLVFAGGGADEDDLIQLLLHLLKFERTVVEGGGQPEAIIHQGAFAGIVAAVHRPQLGQHDVTLVHEQQKVLGKIVQQRGGGGARGAAAEHRGVVFNALAHAHFLEHFHVVAGALGDPLGLQQLALFGEFAHLHVHLFLNAGKSGTHFFRRDDVVAGREDGDMLNDVFALAGEGVHLADTVHLVAKEFHPDGGVAGIGQVYLHRVAPDAELVAHKVDVVALIL